MSPWDLVSSLAWSADGKRIAAAAGENVHLYDAVSLQEVKILKVRAWVSRLVFLSQENVGGYFLGLAVKDGPVQVWDADQGQQICNFKGHTRGSNSVAFSQKAGFLASTGNDGYVRLWEVLPALGKGICPEAPFAELIGGAFAVSDVEFSPDGALVASASDQLIHLREPGTGRLVQTLFGESPLFDLVFSPDGKTLASAEQGAAARLWDVQSGDIVTTLERPEGSALPPGVFLWSVAFSPDGRWLAGGSSDGSLLLWDLAVQPPRSSAFPAHDKALTSLGFCPVGSPAGPGLYLATGGLDGVVKIWMIP